MSSLKVNFTKRPTLCSTDGCRRRLFWRQLSSLQFGSKLIVKEVVATEEHHLCLQFFGETLKKREKMLCRLVLVLRKEKDINLMAAFRLARCHWHRRRIAKLALSWSSLWQPMARQKRSAGSAAALDAVCLRWLAKKTTHSPCLTIILLIVSHIEMSHQIK